MKKPNINAAPYLKKRIYLVALVFSLLFLCPLIFHSTVLAAPLTIGKAPSNEKLNLQQGEKYHGEIVVWNLSQDTITYDIVVRGFRQIENQPGTAIMLDEEEEAKVNYSASSWVKVDQDSVELVPNKNFKVYYDIVVPKDATKGEYNVIIAFISRDGSDKLTGTGTVSVLSSGTPILIKIGSDFVENAELLKFTTDKNFYEFPNVLFSTRIKNLGDTHITPTGEIVLTNIFKKEVARIPFNDNPQSILRENTGNYESMWDFGKFLTKDKHLILGPIDAKLIVTYRSFQPGFAPLTAETSFWIIPWKYILVILIITIATVVVVRKTKKRKSEYKPLPK